MKKYMIDFKGFIEAESKEDAMEKLAETIDRERDMNLLFEAGEVPEHRKEDEEMKSKKFDVVNFGGLEYTIRYCRNPEREYLDEVVIGTEDLERQLFKENEPVNTEAINMDHYIYCYVPETVLKTYSDNDFQKYVDEHF